MTANQLMRPTSSSDWILLYGDFTGVAETPLASPPTPPGTVIVELNLIRAYQHVIFRLEQEIVRYKLLLRQLSPRAAAEEETPAQISRPLNAASVELFTRLMQTPIPESLVLRAFDEEV